MQGNLSNKNGQAYTFSQGNRLRSVANKEWYADNGYGRQVIACGSAACNYQLYSQLGQLLYTQGARKGINTDYIYLAGSSFVWLSRFRRLARDYERLPEALVGLHFIAFTSLMLGNAALTSSPQFNPR
ncbi:transposase [Xanthomonas campestris]|uniref:hypothetical protein n=1 Tax=Xanthomonas campestris TaxID=339 RepID=UPI00216A03E9|nr:hypothetical protein [Xanthomonas campestris]MCS3848242.1 transposase [Xanthomonas campestris]